MCYPNTQLMELRLNRGIYHKDNASDAFDHKLKDSSPPNATATKSTLAYGILDGDKRYATLG